MKSCVLENEQKSEPFIELTFSPRMDREAMFFKGGTYHNHLGWFQDEALIGSARTASRPLAETATDKSTLRNRHEDKVHYNERNQEHKKFPSSWVHIRIASGED